MTSIQEIILGSASVPIEIRETIKLNALKLKLSFIRIPHIAHTLNAITASDVYVCLSIDRYGQAYAMFLPRSNG